MKQVCVHFIGIAADQYYSAWKVWGTPDFVHGRATWSCLGEIAGADIVIFGRGAFSQPKKWKGKTRFFAAHHINPEE